MTNEELDRLLSDEPEIVPSSGFTRAVMTAIDEPPVVPPLAFPWSRALPGMAAGVLVLLTLPMIWMLLPPAPAPAAADAHLRQIVADLTSGNATWVLVAMVTTLLAIVLPRRLFGSNA